MTICHLFFNWCKQMKARSPRLSNLSYALKPRANGRNIVGQQHPTLLDVTCCVRLHTLLHVVAKSLKPVKLFSQQLPTFLLFRDRRSVAQQCWIRLHTSSSVVDLWVVFFPRCTAGPKLVGSCCIRLHTTANTHATTSNIVGATMLGVVAPVCTQPYSFCKVSLPLLSSYLILIVSNFNYFCGK